MIRITFLLASVLCGTVLFQSCAPSQAFIDRMEQAEPAAFNGVTIRSRGAYFLVGSQCGERHFSCNYYRKSNTYRFPSTMDSLLRLDRADSLETIRSLDASVKAFRQLGAGYAKGTQTMLVAENGKFRFVRFEAVWDSLEIADYLGEHRWKRSGNVYYYRQR